MYNRVEISRVSPDGLTRQYWIFILLDGFRLRVDYYAMQGRASTRHKWRDTSENRYDFSEPLQYHSGIKRHELPLPCDVIADAKLAILDRLIVMR